MAIASQEMCILHSKSNLGENIIVISKAHQEQDWQEFLVLRERELRKFSKSFNDVLPSTQDSLEQSDSGTSSGVFNDEDSSSQPTSKATASYESERKDFHTSKQRLLVVANRLPVSAIRRGEDSWQLEISVGGLVSALLDVKEFETKWIGWAVLNVPDEIGQKSLTKALAEKVMLGVDRLDMIKGIPQKILAFEKFLDENPIWRSKVVLLQIAVPTRTEVPEYQKLRSQVHAIVGRINGRFGTLTEDCSLDFHELCALYVVTDVALLTSLRDGMNLVSYEFVAFQAPKKGVLILSDVLILDLEYTFVQAAQSLGSGAILINLWNITEVASSISYALNMPANEREMRHHHNFMHVTSHTSQEWAATFVSELNDTIVEAKLRTRQIPPPLPFEVVVERYTRCNNRLIILGLYATLTEPADTLGRKDSQIKELRPKLRPGLQEPLRKLCDDPKTTVLVLSGSSRSVLDDNFGDYSLWMAAENGMFLRSTKGEWITTMPEKLLDLISSPRTSLIWNYKYSVGEEEGRGNDEQLGDEERGLGIEERDLGIESRRNGEQESSAGEQIQTSNTSKNEGKNLVLVTVVNDKSRFTYKTDEPGILKVKPDDCLALKNSSKPENQMGLNVPVNQRVEVVTMYLTGKAEIWFDGYIMQKHLVTWHEFEVDLCHRFSDRSFADIVEEFPKLTQKGSIEDYQERFEELQPHMLLQNPTLNEDFFCITFHQWT
ncbi:Alpha,alpha-trehalose-phosphate synthase 1 [Hibiscus syriacus]|uniref:Alpha,alpha-trehalose-phosphate synthase 1 n=1 Tax=Hibiscus syriacus TaxID=106335 RepID=A0A6A2ZHP2_HIBSY|nr:Alpha,alpha-trehalose-phosphate synthase 1 [Hibiscus syriacus]